MRSNGYLAKIPFIVLGFAQAAGRYAALLPPLLKLLEFELMSTGASLIAAACISASLASKFENATTINSTHIARVESTNRTATCSSYNNAETAAAANSQKNLLRRRLCNFSFFKRLIKPTPFVSFDGHLCAVFRPFITVKQTYHLRFPISQLLSSHQCLGSDHSFS